MNIRLINVSVARSDCLFVCLLWQWFISRSEGSSLLSSSHLCSPPYMGGGHRCPLGSSLPSSCHSWSAFCQWSNELPNIEKGSRSVAPAEALPSINGPDVTPRHPLVYTLKIQPPRSWSGEYSLHWGLGENKLRGRMDKLIWTWGP